MQTTKSAFPKITQRVAAKPAAAAPLIKTPEAVKQPVSSAQPPVEKQAPPAPRALEPLPGSVELWLELVNRSDREVFGWNYLFRGRNVAVVVVLNRHHWLAQSALTGSEPRLLPLLCAIELSEALLFRKDRWVKATFQVLRKKVSPANPAVGNLHFFAERLAVATQLTELGARILAEPEKLRHLIATVELGEYQK